MADSPSSRDENVEIAHRIQQKFDFFLIALTFSILGLSIQTAHFGQARTPAALELMGWSGLLISGLVGLSRLEWLPQLYHSFSFREDMSTRVGAVRKASQMPNVVVRPSEDGTTPSITELISQGESNLSRIDSSVKTLEALTFRRYRVQRLTFALGTTALVCARGLGPLVGLFGYALR